MSKRKKLFKIGGWGVACILLLLPLAASAIENNECMECHSDDSLTRAASSGMKDLLFVDGNKFKYSVHNVNGIACVDCHSDITALNYDNEVPHEKDLAPVHCEQCHEAIGESYKDSVHKKAGKKGITIPCYACHDYHYTKNLDTASVQERQNNFCRKCHDPNKFHEWLPQKETHFAFIECIVCHAPDTPRHINLKVFDLVQNRFLDSDELLKYLETDEEHLMPRIDTNKNNVIDENEFINMVLMLRKWDIRATFHGELVADIEPSIHQVNRGGASRECAQCHTAESPFFHDVRLPVIQGDGNLVLYDVSRDVLETYHVEFNALGSTRVRLLDVIGIALLIGGAAVVIFHLSARLITAPLRKKKEMNK